MQKKKYKRIWWLCLVGLALFTAGITGIQKSESIETSNGILQGEQKNRVDITETVDIDTVGMIEDTTIYDNDKEDSIVYFYVTVRKGDAGSETNHTFAEVNSVVRFVDSKHFANDIYAEAIVQQGDQYGPVLGMFGYGEIKANAKIRVRGNSSSVRPQKSYKLELKDEAGLWRGQSNIALNKSVFDVTKIKSKLYFDMLRKIENVPSLRTQFVRLFIKDETAGKTSFEDYGIFTQIEVPSKKYLGNHGLDREGYLYKAIGFNFEPSDALKNFNDPNFDLEAFEQVLSCKGREDNQKVLDLVEMINDTSVDINEIIGTYIDRDNYVTWLAYNILLANIDTTQQNFYLYSPLNSEKWFFVPWDGDNMLHVNEELLEGTSKNYGAWQHGISNYWGIILHQRFLKYEANRKALEEKVDELHENINKKSVDALVQKYNAVVEPYVTSMPDFYYLGHTKEERDMILEGLGQEVEDAYMAFKESLHELMPFWLYMLEPGEETHILTWSDAYDFENASITYHLQISAKPDMSNPVVDEMELDDTEYQISKDVLTSGTWYWKVTAQTDDGKTAEAMNKIKVNDIYYPGVDILEVP